MDFPLKKVRSHIGVLLKGGAERVGAGNRISGAYGNLLCHTVIVLIVIYTVLYTANDSLDALIGRTTSVFICFHLFHLLYRCENNMHLQEGFYTKSLKKGVAAICLFT